jgi:rubrerythrin
MNPLQENGIPIEKQFVGWSEANVQPYDKTQVHPYTRVRGIFMNGIEVEAALFGHQFARHTDDMELKRRLALTRRAEQQQQKMVNWMIPADENVVEVTIGYEQVAVDLTAWLARHEPDPYVKAALDFALLEDFDHLYRYANLLDLAYGKPAGEITGKYTEITVGRPTRVEHRHPFDDVRRHYDKGTADIRTMLNAATIVAAEQQTMNFYMNVGNRPEDMTGRGLYLEIAQVEEQHVTHYESLMDPRETWFERLVMHEYNECWLYHSLAQQEPDERVKAVWERHLAMEIEHLRIACDLLRRHEKREPEEMLPAELPEPLVFESNVDYVRGVLAEQVDFRAVETEFLSRAQASKNGRYKEHRKRYQDHQKKVNAGGAPSEQVVEEHRRAKGGEYRQELAGPHPVEAYRA